jgi:hypothetical protein
VPAASSPGAGDAEGAGVPRRDGVETQNIQGTAGGVRRETAWPSAGHRPSPAGGPVPASKLVWAGSGRHGTTIVRAGKHHGGDPASARCGSTVLAPVGRAITDGSSGGLA